MNAINQNSIFSVLLVLLFSLVISHITPPSLDENMELILSKSRAHITTIDQTRSISTVRNIMIDEVNLHEKSRFYHPKLGILGWSNDFFADIQSSFTVSKAGTYRFVVGSDDGFALEIDGKRLCSFASDRAYSRQNCSARLTEGDHQLKLSYFQGYGNAGLTLQYLTEQKGKLRYWGENSKELKIKKGAN